MSSDAEQPGSRSATSQAVGKYTASSIGVPSVNTVLGSVNAAQLGITLVHESLLYVLPGAQYAYDIRIDRAEVFDALATKLAKFKAAGGGTIVDATGMFQGRDLRLYEALARASGVNIVASTGQGPEAMLGGYFLTPQTNPPTPWPAEKFAAMFSKEVTDGMVVPRLERRGHAGLVATAVTIAGMTPTDGSLVRGAARTGATTGVPVLIKCGSDAVAELTVAVDEGLAADRVVIGDADRRDAVAKGWPARIVAAGARIAIDHVGSTNPQYISDAERVALINELVSAGHANRIHLSASATGVSFGVPGNNVPYSDVLTNFVPMLRAAGVTAAHIDQLLINNPAALLSIGG
jgi:phosphotriesterase-related protein